MSMKSVISTQWDAKSIHQVTQLAFIQAVPCSGSLGPGCNVGIMAPRCSGGGGQGHECGDIHFPMSTPLDPIEDN